MERHPDFFLSTAGEFSPLAAPRACWQNGRCQDDARDDHMLIEIQPALEGQRFGLGATNISHLIISGRHRGQTLYPVSEWPFFVYVARILDNAVLASNSFTRRQIELIAWGTLFRTYKEASDHAASTQR